MIDICAAEQKQESTCKAVLKVTRHTNIINVCISNHGATTLHGCYIELTTGYTGIDDMFCTLHVNTGGSSVDTIGATLSHISIEWYGT